MLLAYKSQPSLEKRFSHMKTDFEVAPVYLKEASRIQALLCVYFLALLTESLLEREFRRAMDREAIASLPLYPEGRKCRRPTARRVDRPVRRRATSLAPSREATADGLHDRVEPAPTPAPAAAWHDQCL